MTAGTVTRQIRRGGERRRAHDPVARARARIASAIRSLAAPPDLSISEWADQKAYIPQGIGPVWGKWQTERAPFQREMMDTILDPGVEEVDLMTSSQVGKTSIVLKIIGYFIDQDPTSILAVLPTVELAEDWSKERLAPEIAATPCLARKVSDAKSRDENNTMRGKAYAGGRLTLVGANAPSGLAMRSCRVVVLDEVDRFPISAGTEGDPISLAERRQTNFWNRKRILTSSPGVKGISRIEKGWDASDQRRRFVPCPYCGHFQVLKFNPDRPSLGYYGTGGLVWEKDENGKAIAGTVRYRCESCAEGIEEQHKAEMDRRGEWRATFPGRKVPGFHVWAAYSPWTTWEEIVAEWDRKHEDPVQLQVFVTTILGEPWEADPNAIEADGLKARLETWEGEVPVGAGLLTMQVDVQANRLEFQVNAWGEGEESWRVAYGTIPGDPGAGDRSIWGALDRLRRRGWKHASGRVMPIDITVVDSGGHHTDAVYDYAAPRLGERVFAVKGMAGPREIVGKAKRTERERTTLYIVGVDTVKDMVWSRLKMQVPKIGDRVPGFIHLGTDCDDDYLAGLLSEWPKRAWVKGVGWTRVWTLKRNQNEPWDLTVYGVAALHILGPAWILTIGQRAAEWALPPDAAPRPDPVGVRIRGRRAGWVTAPLRR